MVRSAKTKRPIPDIVVVSIEGDLTVMFRQDLEGGRIEATGICNLTEALNTLGAIEVRKVRSELQLLLDAAEMPPSEQVIEFMEATQPYQSAEFSPLPALTGFDKFDPDKDNHDLLAYKNRLEKVHWVALVDWDNTLYKSDSEHSIMLHQFAKFLKERHAGELENNLTALNELIEYCNKWERQRTMISQGRPFKAILEELELKELIDYEEGIKESAKKSAAAFQGLNIKKLEEYGREFVQTAMGGKLFAYVRPVLKRLRDYGILPVITTGLPDFLVPAILEKTGTTHGKGTTYKTDESGNLTGFVDVNMGLADGKNAFGNKLTEKGYAIVVTKGDSESDMGMHRCAVGRGQHKHDVHGGSVSVNASAATEQEVRRTYGEDIKQGFVRIVEPGKNSDDVVAAIGLTLRKIFAPSHRYAELKRDTEHPEELEKFLEELEQQLREADEIGKESEARKSRAELESEEEPKSERGQPTDGEDDKIISLETIKRLRDILRKREGLSEAETTLELRRFFPDILVEYVMKPHNLDTRDDDAVCTFVDKTGYLVDTRRPESLETHLERIGLTRACIAEVMLKNDEYNTEKGIRRPIFRQMSSVPPPPPPPVYSAIPGRNEGDDDNEDPEN